LGENGPFIHERWSVFKKWNKIGQALGLLRRGQGNGDQGIDEV